MAAAGSHCECCGKWLRFGGSGSSPLCLDCYSGALSVLYVLGDDGRTPAPSTSILSWLRLMGTAPDRHVGHHEQGDVSVSTVFLGIDHGFGDGRPVLFETMVFGGPEDGAQERYSTWADASDGHARWTKKVFGTALRARERME